VPPRLRLQAMIGDASGINVTGEVGHQIILTIDDQRTDVTDLFETGADFRQGEVAIDLPLLEPGDHDIGLEAWDNHNNWSEQQVTAVVELAPEVSQALFYPNPSKGDGHFTFALSVPAEVHIVVFSVGGRRVDEVHADGLLGYNQIAWEPGLGLANGSYLFRISARAEVGEATAEGVIQIAR
jgi:hypothetical protein